MITLIGFFGPNHPHVRNAGLASSSSWHDHGPMKDGDAPQSGQTPLARLRAAGAYDKFTRWTKLPMLALSLVFLAVLVVPVLDQSLSVGWANACGVAGVVIWAVFVAEYLTRLLLTPERGRFLLHNIPDLLAVVLPVLRPVRLVRLARMARFVRTGALATRTARHGRGRLHIQVAIQVATAAVLVLFIGSVGMFDVERDAPNGNIRTFGDALWWAITTVTTVGYGDRYPVTGEGRLIAAAVMITGIAVLGVITASIASWFVGNIQAVQRSEAQQVSREERLEVALTEVLERLTRIEAHLGIEPGSLPAPVIPPEPA